MYSFFKGKVVEKLNDRVILETNSIGYEIYMPESDINKIELDKDLKIYTYFHVREDEMRLFGFLNNEQLNFFKKLISVSGVGPKAAIGIISNISVSDMCVAIATENLLVLKTVPGIGPKMAQKIIFELKDKVVKEQMANIDGKSNMQSMLGSKKNITEAITALEALGFSLKQIEPIITKLEIKDETVEQIIKKVLSYMKR